MIRPLVIAAILGAAAVVSVAGAAPVSIELPQDDTPFPDLGAGAPQADTINENCRSCHSASMVLNQPRMGRDAWAAEVTKMRGTYKAPIDEKDDAAIIAWLVAMSERLPAPKPATGS